MPDGLTLKTTVHVKCAIMRASVHAATRLSPMLPVLAHAEDGGATPESLSADILPGWRPVSRRLLDICHENGLLERHGNSYEITQMGKSAIADGRVFVLKCGMWKMYRAVHPLITSERQVLKIAGGQKEAEYNPGDSPPEFTPNEIRRLSGQTLRASFGDVGVFRLDDVADRVKGADGTTAGLTLEIGPEGSTLSLSLNGETCLMDGPAIRVGDAWRQILESNGVGDWDEAHDRLLVSYDGARADERRAMAKTLEVEPNILGTRFEPLTVAVAIYPKNGHDADRWADELFVYRIDDYLTQEKHREIAARVRADFSEFEIPLKDRAHYVSHTERGSAKFWYIQAAVDWNI